MVSYREAERACSAEGKRLCEADEWMFACEGERTLPYPYGLERDPGACNIDRRPRDVDARALENAHQVSVEVERLDRRVPSGSLDGCKSPFGVFDTTGNVAEWVHNRAGDRHKPPYATALAGGYWGRVPATCRRLGGAPHADDRTPFSGFRCCRDAVDGRKARRMFPAGRGLPKRRKVLGR
jgi:formylglycine-generating enzyme required for sulfatase activity